MRLGLRPAADRDASLQLLRQVERWSVDGTTAEEMAEGCSLLDVIEDGRRVGCVAVRLHGPAATITAAVSHGCATWRHMDMVEDSLRLSGVTRVAAFTRRPGLVRRLARRGYQPVRPADEDGCIELEKEL